MVENNPENQQLKENFNTTLTWLKETDNSLISEYLKTDTFYKIMIYKNFENEEAKEVIKKYLSKELEKGYQCQLKNYSHLFGRKKDITTVDKSEIQEAQIEKLTKPLSQSSNVQPHAIYTTLIPISFKIGTIENTILWEFMSRLRKEEAVKFNPLIVRKFNKVKWFHFILFALFLALNIFFSFSIYMEEKYFLIFLFGLILTGFFFLYEIIVWVKLGNNGYLKSTTNYLDILMLALTGGLLIWNQFKNEDYSSNLTRNYLNLVICFTLNIRCIAYLRCIDGLRSLIQSIKEVLSKMFFFSLLMFCYIFVIIGTKYGKEEIDKVQFSSKKSAPFSNKFLESLLLNFGEISFPVISSEDSDPGETTIGDNWLQWLITTLHALIVVVMMFNLLVGILSNGFDEFQEKSQKMMLI